MLHIINKSHSESSVLRDCLEFVEPGSVILLIENAVLSAKSCASSSLLKAAPANVSVYVLSPDLQARGIPQGDCYEYIRCVDYAGFVELVALNNPVQSWF